MKLKLRQQTRRERGDNQEDRRAPQQVDAAVEGDQCRDDDRAPQHPAQANVFGRGHAAAATGAAIFSRIDAMSASAAALSLAFLSVRRCASTGTATRLT